MDARVFHLGHYMKRDAARAERNDRRRSYERPTPFPSWGRCRFLTEQELTEWYAAIERARSAMVVLKLQEEK